MIFGSNVQNKENSVALIEGESFVGRDCSKAFPIVLIMSSVQNFLDYNSFLVGSNFFMQVPFNWEKVFSRLLYSMDTEAKTSTNVSLVFLAWLPKNLLLRNDWVTGIRLWLDFSLLTMVRIKFSCRFQKDNFDKTWIKWKRYILKHPNFVWPSELFELCFIFFVKGLK